MKKKYQLIVAQSVDRENDIHTLFMYYVSWWRAKLNQFTHYIFNKKCSSTTLRRIPFV